MAEKTLIKTMDLPRDHRGWILYADANMIVLASWLDEAGRQRALDDLQARWRRSYMDVA